MRRFVFYLLFIPAAVLVLLFALANREMVVVSLDPFSRDVPALTFQSPLFLVLFAVLMLGVLVGGMASWIGQAKHRRAARRARAEAERYRAEADRLRSELAGTAPPSQPALPAPVPF
jgi:uncharacterized integral membrane protein